MALKLMQSMFAPYNNHCSRLRSGVPSTPGNFNDDPNVVINAFSYQGSKKLVVPKASAEQDGWGLRS